MMGMSLSQVFASAGDDSRYVGAWPLAEFGWRNRDPISWLLVLLLLIAAYVLMKVCL